MRGWLCWVDVLILGVGGGGGGFFLVEVGDLEGEVGVLKGEMGSLLGGSWGLCLCWES